MALAIGWRHGTWRRRPYGGGGVFFAVRADDVVANAFEIMSGKSAMPMASGTGGFMVPMACNHGRRVLGLSLTSVTRRAKIRKNQVTYVGSQMRPMRISHRCVACRRGWALERERWRMAADKMARAGVRQSRRTDLKMR